MSLLAILANFLGWPILQFGFAALFHNLPADWFVSSPLTPQRARCARLEMVIYRDWFGVRTWKGRLPDGGPWLRGGFSKQKLMNRNAAYLERFAVECRRGELAHWTMLACTPIFFLWNPPWARVVMLLYGLLANLPCVIAQRYNRALISTRLMGYQPKQNRD